MTPTVVNHHSDRAIHTSTTQSEVSRQPQGQKLNSHKSNRSNPPNKASSPSYLESLPSRNKWTEMYLLKTLNHTSVTATSGSLPTPAQATHRTVKMVGIVETIWKIYESGTRRHAS